MIEVSLILLHYKNTSATLHCLDSLKNLPKNYEIILVDNDENRILPKLHGVKYISLHQNLGFGGGINLGAKVAQGKYLFVLNNDCYLLPGSLQILVEFLDSHPHTAVASPMLLDKNQQRYPLVGTHSLTPWTGLFALTFINKYFPHNPVSRGYWVRTGGLSQPTSIDVAPGTAFLVRKSVFTQVGGFDEKFFLYFEEADLCKRIRDAGYEIFLLPSAHLIHYWAQSTPHDSHIQTIFSHSRFYYFKKHFGLFWSLVVHLATLPLHQLSLFFILFLGTFLRFYRLSSTMMFIGDQAWFYDSAKSAILGTGFPIAGITSSVVWLHQGPLYTYFLIPELLISRFSPISGSFLTSFLGVITILLIYYLARLWGNKRFALISSFIYSLSPLVVIHARMPYHTSVIPFFLVLMLLFLYRQKYFLALLFLGFLYQSELATVILWPIVLFFLIRQRYRLNIMDFLGFGLGILPFVISGVVQTFGVFLWSLYHLIFHQVSAAPATNFYIDLASRFIFPHSIVISLFLFTICFVSSLRHFRPFLIWLLFPLLAMVMNRTPSEAYFVILFVPLSLMLGYGLSFLPKVLPLFFLVNIYFLLSTNYLSRPGDYYAPALKDRLLITHSILSQSSTNTPYIKTIGPGDQFATTQLPYPYLVWWLSQYQSPAGNNDSFQVLEPAQSVQVLK